MKKKNCTGLTFIELLLAISLFSVIGTILYSVLFQGLNAWNREYLNDTESGEERMIIEQIGNSFRNTFYHSWVNFLGEANQIYFCTLVIYYNQESAQIEQLSKTHFFFLKKDRGRFKKGLYRIQSPIEYVFSENPPDSVLISNVFSNFSFEYGYWDSLEKKIITKPQWFDSKKIPRLLLIKAKSKKMYTAYFVNHLGELPKIEETMFGNE